MRDRYASLREGLVGAWIPSISGSGLLLPDLSGQGNNGTLTNMGPEDWVAGEYGRALDFDGVDDYVSTKLSTLANTINSNVFTVIANVFFRSFSGPPTICVIKSSTLTSSFLFQTNTLGTRIFIRAADNALGLTGLRLYDLSTPLSTNIWHNICFTKTGSGDFGRLFVDVKEETTYTGALQNSVVAATYDLIFGVFAATPANPLNGQLDDVRIYNRALSEPEIKLLASRPGIGLRPQRRTMYYAPPTGARRRRILTSMP